MVVDVADDPAVFCAAPPKLTRSAARAHETLGRPENRTVHLLTCRHAASARSEDSLGLRALRTAQVMLLLEAGAGSCGACKPDRRVLSINPAWAGRLAGVQQRRRATPHPVTPSRVSAILRNAPVGERVDVSVKGSDGILARKRVSRSDVYVVLTNYEITFGPVNWRDDDLERAVRLLVAANLHVRLGVADSSAVRFGSYGKYGKVIVLGSTPAQDDEGLYATIDPELLLRALKLNISTREALEMARSGHFNSDGLGMLAAFGAGDPESLRLLSAQRFVDAMKR